MLAGPRDVVESRDVMASGKRILLGDDDAHLRAALTEQLAEDFVPVEAATAAEGRALALSETFDAILLDVGLPDQDGRALCRALRCAGIACASSARPRAAARIPSGGRPSAAATTGRSPRARAPWRPRSPRAAGGT